MARTDIRQLEALTAGVGTATDKALEEGNGLSTHILRHMEAALVPPSRLSAEA